jgi:cysteine desulfurase
VKTIYLDHNASTPLAPSVIQAMQPWLAEATGNPSSGHSAGRRSRDAVDRARRQLAGLLGCHPIEMIFTGGGTESNNMVLQGLARRFPGSHFITSAVEHPAILEVCRWLEGQGIQLTILPVDRTGMVAPRDLEAAMRPETKLVSIMLANNELGTLNPIAELAEVAHAGGALMHTDAAQALGKIPVKVSELGVDLLSVAGHKLNAPKGVGALYLKNGVELPPLMFGAGHERGYRPGTENVLELVGLGAAAALWTEEVEGQARHYRRLRDRFEALLKAGIPGLGINGHLEKRLPNTSSLSFPGLRMEDLLLLCPQIEASAGAACHADQTTPSHVLSAIGLDPESAACTGRFSIGLGTTEEDVELAARMLVGACRGRNGEGRMKKDGKK